MALRFFRTRLASYLSGQGASTLPLSLASPTPAVLQAKSGLEDIKLTYSEDGLTKVDKANFGVHP